MLQTLTPSVDTAAAAELAESCAASLAAIAERAPRVHCLTNPVAMTLTANVLLAVGARPSMTQTPDQLGEFIAASDTLCVNLGMLDEARQQGIDQALTAAAQHAVPWVLDPVKVHLSATRRSYAQNLLARQPAVIRANQREFAALLDSQSATDTTDIDAGLQQLAHQQGCVIACTGTVDRLCDGRRQFAIAGGDPMLARMVALGCALSALLAAFLAVQDDPLLASAQALLAMKTAGQQAAAQSPGPGTLAVRVLDELYTLTPERLLATQVQA